MSANWLCVSDLDVFNIFFSFYRTKKQRFHISSKISSCYNVLLTKKKQLIVRPITLLKEKYCLLHWFFTDFWSKFKEKYKYWMTKIHFWCENWAPNKRGPPLIRKIKPNKRGGPLLFGAPSFTEKSGTVASIYFPLCGPFNAALEMDVNVLCINKLMRSRFFLDQ